jgi:hypothetical protein
MTFAEFCAATGYNQTIMLSGRGPDNGFTIHTPAGRDWFGRKTACRLTFKTHGGDPEYRLSDWSETPVEEGIPGRVRTNLDGLSSKMRKRVSPPTVPRKTTPQAETVSGQAPQLESEK